MFLKLSNLLVKKGTQIITGARFISEEDAPIPCCIDMTIRQMMLFNGMWTDDANVFIKFLATQAKPFLPLNLYGVNGYKQNVYIVSEITEKELLDKPFIEIDENGNTDSSFDGFVDKIVYRSMTIRYKRSNTGESYVGTLASLSAFLENSHIFEFLDVSTVKYTIDKKIYVECLSQVSSDILSKKKTENFIRKLLNPLSFKFSYNEFSQFPSKSFMVVLEFDKQIIPSVGNIKLNLTNKGVYCITNKDVLNVREDGSFDIYGQGNVGYIDWLTHSSKKEITDCFITRSQISTSKIIERFISLDSNSVLAYPKMYLMGKATECASKYSVIDKAAEIIPFFDEFFKSEHPIEGVRHKFNVVERYKIYTFDKNNPYGLSFIEVWDMLIKFFNTNMSHNLDTVHLEHDNEEKVYLICRYYDNRF